MVKKPLDGEANITIKPGENKPEIKAAKKEVPGEQNPQQKPENHGEQKPLQIHNAGQLPQGETIKPKTQFTDAQISYSKQGNIEYLELRLDNGAMVKLKREGADKEWQVAKKSMDVKIPDSEILESIPEKYKTKSPGENEILDKELVEAENKPLEKTNEQGKSLDGKEDGKGDEEALFPEFLSS